jgi:hypothetical protein
MKLDDNQVATISLQELHDILGNGDLGITDPATGQLMLPAGFELEVIAMDPQTEGNMNKIMNRLNAVRDELAKLDSAFHDEFDGAYC